MKKLTIGLAVALLVVVVVMGVYMATPEQERAYKKETAKMKMIKEHQMLQLEVLQINAAINRFSAPAAAVPITPTPGQ